MSTTPTATSTAGMLDARGRGYRHAVIGLVAVILVTAFALSATALAAVATWAGVHGPLRWAMAVLLDAGVLAATATALHERPRGQRGRVAAAWTVVGLLTLMSAALNACHAWATAGALGWQRVAGAALAATPPLLVWVTSHALAWVTTTTDAEREAAADAVTAAQVAAARREARARAAVARATAEVEDAPTPTPAVDAAPPSTPATRTTTPAASAPRSQRPTLDAATRDRVAAMRAAGASERQIATELGLSKSTVHRLVASEAASPVGALLEAVA